MATRMENADTFSTFDDGDERYGNFKDEQITTNNQKHHDGDHTAADGDGDASRYFGSISRAAEEGMKTFSDFVSAQQEGWSGRGGAAADHQTSLYNEQQNSLLLTLPTFDEMRNALPWNNNVNHATATAGGQAVPEFEDLEDISTLGTPPQLRVQQQPPQYNRPRRAPPSPHGSRSSNDQRLQGVSTNKNDSGNHRNPTGARGKSVTRNAPRGRAPVRGRSVSRTRGERSRSRGKSMERRQPGSGPRGRSLSTPRQNGRNNTARGRSRSRSRGPPNRKAGVSKGRKAGPGNVTPPANKHGFFSNISGRSVARKQQPPPQRNVRRGPPPGKEPRRPVPKKTVRKQPSKQHHKDDDSSKASSGRMSSAMDAIWRRVKPSTNKKGNNGKKGKGQAGGKQPQQNLKNRQHPRGRPITNGPTKSAVVKKNPARNQNHHQAVPQRKNVKRQEKQGSQEGRRRAGTPPVGIRQRAVDVEEREAPEPTSSVPTKLVTRQPDNESQWLGAITDSFVTPWSQKKKDSNMAAFENDRLGDAASKSVRRQRLESAHEVVEETNFVPVQSHELDSLTNSVSFELTTIGSSSHTETEGSRSLRWSPLMKREYLNRHGRVNSAWHEVAESADVIARYVEDPDGRDSVSSVAESEFRQAVTTFREHARRLGIGEKRLYATVRDDPSILQDSTYDDETLDDLWLNVGRTIDQRIDSYVDAFESVFNRVQTFNDAHSCAPISVKDERRRLKANE